MFFCLFFCLFSSFAPCRAPLSPPPGAQRGHSGGAGRGDRAAVAIAAPAAAAASSASTFAPYSNASRGGGGRGCGPGLRGGCHCFAQPPRLRSGRAQPAGSPEARRPRTGAEPYCRAGGGSRAGLRRVTGRWLTLLSCFPRRRPRFPSASSRLLATVGQHADRPLTGAMERDRGGAHGDRGERGGGCGRLQRGCQPPPCPSRRETTSVLHRIS